jgi:hypothetical protein
LYVPSGWRGFGFVCFEGMYNKKQNLLSNHRPCQVFQIPQFCFVFSNYLMDYGLVPIGSVTFITDIMLGLALLPTNISFIPFITKAIKAHEIQWGLDTNFMRGNIQPQPLVKELHNNGYHGKAQKQS